MVVPFYVPIPVPVAAPIDKLALEADPRMFQSLPEARKSASSRRESTCVVQCVSRSADKIQFVRSVKLAPRSTADTKCPNIYLDATSLRSDDRRVGKEGGRTCR